MAVKSVALRAKLGAANNVDGNRIPKIIGNNALVFLIFRVFCFVFTLGLKRVLS